MDKKLYRRLIKTGLISAPIMALYGVTPVYLFNKIPGNLLLFAGIGVLVNVLLFWLVNIWLIRTDPDDVRKWKRWALSYLLSSVAHLVLVLPRTLLDVFSTETLSPYESNFVVYPLVSVFAINTIILIICNSVLLAHKKEKAELEIEHLKVNNLEAQKKVLMQQLQPHFLFNTLSVLKSLIRQYPGEAESYTMKLSEFLRYTMQAHNSNLVPLRQELKFTQDYLELQKMRFENSLRIGLDIPQEALDWLLPAYALQTLVENAIKHNAFTDKKPLHISISCAQDRISVCNNKLLSKAEGSPGMGLKNLNDRYRLIADKEIIIADQNHQFCVTVPLIPNESL